MTVRREVHRQERDVRAHVRAAKALAELDAVDDRELAFVAEVEVLEPEIAVTVADASVRDADARRCARDRGENRAASARSRAPAAAVRSPPPRASTSAKFSRTLRAMASTVPQPDVGAVAARARVKVREHRRRPRRRERPRASRPRGARRRASSSGSRIMWTAQSTTSPSGPKWCRPCGVAPHGHEAEVGARGEARVEEHLGFARTPPRIERAEVEEREA